MGNDELPLSPVRAYHHAGRGHCTAADLLADALASKNVAEKHVVWLALENVIGFAAENALKAYLCANGVEKSELQFPPFGHKLDKLLERAIELGLQEAGNKVSEPELVAALKKYVNDCGPSYTSFGYRYLEGAKWSVLDSIHARKTVIRAIECVIDIVGKKIEEC